MAEIVIKENVVQIDTLKIGKGNANTSMAITSTGVVIINGGTRLEIDWKGTTVDGVAVTSASDLSEKLEEVFKRGGGAGGNGGVESVTGDLVDNTDSKNPIVNLPSDVLKDSDTSNTNSAGKIPVYSPQGQLSTGMPTSLKHAISLSFFNSFISVSPAGGKIPIYSEQGLLSTGMPEFPENAVPLSYLDGRIPMPPADGSYSLKSVDGSVSWVAE